MGCEGVDWINEAHGRPTRQGPTVDACEPGNEPSGSINREHCCHQLSD
jgi:hypothetical protein